MKKFIISLICVAFLTTFLLMLKNNNTKQKTTTLTKVKVAEVTHSIFYTPLYIAHANGYFKDNGLDVEIILTSGVNKIYLHYLIIPYLNIFFFI